MKQSMASAAALLCAGCALGAPSGVRVKTAPAIRVSSGGATTKLDDYLSADILKNLLGEYSKAEYYQYGKENTLHILVRYNLVAETLDFEKLRLEDAEALEDFLGEDFPYTYPDDDPDIISIDISSLIKVNETSITGINLKTFKEALPKNLGFESVTARIYAGPKDEQYKLYGTIYARYGDRASFPILDGSHNEDGTVDFKGKLPSSLKEGESRVLAPKDFARYPEPSFLTAESGTSSLAAVFNAWPEDLAFDFDVAPQIGSISGMLTLPVKDILEMDSLQLYIDMTLDISLAFVAADPDKPAVICLDDIPGIDAGGEQDIFGRKSLEENGELFDSVQAATLRLSYDNSLTSSDLTANIRNSKDARALTVRPFTVKHGTNQTVEIALDAGYVRNNLLYPKDIELAFIPKDDPARTLFSFGPGDTDPKSPKYGEGGAFTLRGVEVETSLDHTFHF
ncbi:hypothetical protein [Treponema endosymbiont of Eucomonympha sp.]|uniref:hypothetical protein n=1 Tax=Treponema endosymbiont of Eucomonympha sp. TaxID=1580831 RepID=UPI000A563A5D|nr:hypothetical protein [Treponema endosymbiont of Eucomonympha sp.]